MAFVWGAEVFGVRCVRGAQERERLLLRGVCHFSRNRSGVVFDQGLTGSAAWRAIFAAAEKECCGSASIWRAFWLRARASAQACASSDLTGRRCDASASFFFLSRGSFRVWCLLWQVSEQVCGNRLFDLNAGEAVDVQPLAGRALQASEHLCRAFAGGEWVGLPADCPGQQAYEDIRLVAFSVQRQDGCEGR